MVALLFQWRLQCIKICKKTLSWASGQLLHLVKGCRQNSMQTGLQDLSSVEKLPEICYIYFFHPGKET